MTDVTGIPIMPANASKDPKGPSRKGHSFNPPRPAHQSSNKKRKTDKGASIRRKSAPTQRASCLVSDEEEDDEDDGSSEGDIIDEEAESQSREDDDEEEASDASPSSTIDNDPPPSIPPALLSTLVHHHFPSDKTRVNKDAMGVVGKYMETFVREAIARAALERHEVLETAASRSAGDDFLEVDDLEKLAPQLLLDF